MSSYFVNSLQAKCYRNANHEPGNILTNEDDTTGEQLSMENRAKHIQGDQLTGISYRDYECQPRYGFCGPTPGQNDVNGVYYGMHSPTRSRYIQGELGGGNGLLGKRVEDLRDRSDRNYHQYMPISSPYYSSSAAQQPVDSSYRDVMNTVTPNEQSPIRSSSKSPSEKHDIVSAPVVTQPTYGCKTADEPTRVVVKNCDKINKDDSCLSTSPSLPPLLRKQDPCTASSQFKGSTKQNTNNNNNGSPSDNNEGEVSEEESEESSDELDSTTNNTNKPQIYPWMRRAHSVYGQF